MALSRNVWEHSLKFHSCPDMVTCYCKVYGLCTNGTDPLKNPFKVDPAVLPKGFELAT